MIATANNVQECWIVKIGSGKGLFIVEKVNKDKYGKVCEIILQKVIKEHTDLLESNPYRYKTDNYSRKWRTTTFNAYNFTKVLEIIPEFCGNCGSELAPLVYCICPCEDERSTYR
jgi:hypothetical protein